jgi:hypothetical protein
MKKILVLLSSLLFLLVTTGLANATLITIGTATYDDGGGDDAYNLIWDNNDDLVWLDYRNSTDTWDNQVSWASGLNGAGVLTYNIDSAYTVDWAGSSWRLPTTEDGDYLYGFDGTTTGGYNITTSEMGDLYYNELENKGYVATNGNSPQDGWGLVNIGDFNNLIASWYWSGTEYANLPDRAWIFNMNVGNQSFDLKSVGIYGLAVRSGQVSAAPIPEPATMLLFGIGLLGLAGVNRKKQ